MRDDFGRDWSDFLRTMNTKSMLCWLLIMALVPPASACINTSGTKYDGSSGSYFGWRGLQAAIGKNLKDDGAEMEKNLRGATDFNGRSDYAVALMFLGRSAEAVELLSKLEQEKPGEFFVAANLGTAYELSGNNADALKWINEGIRRSPQDHEGTEWLHAKILEAKIAQEKDAKYFEKHSVLELHPGKLGEKLVIGANTLTLREVAKAIQYQLGERLQFVKTPDPAVASLLYDYAAIEAVTTSMESAQHILKMATQYGYPSFKSEALSKELDRRLLWERIKFWGLIGAAVTAVLAVLYKRGNFVIWSKA